MTVSVVDEYLLARRRDDKRLLVVLRGDLSSIDELSDFLAELAGLVFLDHVATVRDDMQLVLALHVGDGQLGVHALGPRQEEHLLGLQVQEALSQAREPLGPVLLRRQQVGTPHVL